MRTIFLLTILATLLVIVTKKPDQTFWEAAQGLWVNVEGTASKVAKAPPVPPLTGNAKKDYATLLKQVRRALKIDNGSGDAMVGKSPATGKKSGTDLNGPANIVSSSPTVSPRTRSKPATVGNAETSASSSGGVKVIPRSVVTDLPYIPAVPVAPVEVGKIGESAPPPSRSRPQATGDRNFAEVKAYYENASRLLAEIK